MWQVHPATRAEVELTCSFNTVWGNRSADVVAHTARMYFGSTNGVFRVMPGSRWGHEYDATRRPWYYRAQHHPGAVSLSTPYLDAGGAGRVTTLSMPIFFGKPSSPAASCTSGPRGAACACSSNTQCTSGYCYDGTCSHAVLAGVVATDFKYPFFQKRALDAISGAIANKARACDTVYGCPTGSSAVSCRTACYVVDDSALVTVASAFGRAPETDTYTYADVGLGRMHGAVAAALVAEGVILRAARQDYQGKCDVTPGFEAVPASATNLSMTVAEAEDGVVSRGKFAPFGNTFACLQSVQSYHISATGFDALAGAGGVAQFAYSSGCAGGKALMARVNGTNTYVLVIENMYDNSEDPFRFACHVENRITTQGATQSLSGTCANAQGAPVAPTGTCPALFNPTVQCDVDAGAAVGHVSLWLLVSVIVLLPSMFL